MNGMKHKSRMDAMMGLHIEKSNQLISRIKAEEHLRKIESSPRWETKGYWGGYSDTESW